MIHRRCVMYNGMEFVLLLYSPKKVGYSIHIEFIWTQFNSIWKRCPCLGLPICRICSENDSNWWNWLRGFLAYFMWIRWMKDVGGGCRRALDMVGGLLDLEAAREDVRKDRRSVHFRICCSVCRCHWTRRWLPSLRARRTATRPPRWKPGTHNT